MATEAIQAETGNKRQTVQTVRDGAGAESSEASPLR